MGIGNTILNYGLIFGQLGMPEMGMAGAALASTLSEVLAFSVFLFYVLWDKESPKYNLFRVPKIDIKLVLQQINLSIPIVLQTVASIGSWFVFFALIEKLGENELAISNIIRAVYMLFMIPAWGFSSGINTIVSNLIGQEQHKEVFRAISKTALLCFIVTVSLGLLLPIFPEYILRIGTDDPVLIAASKKLIWILVIILACYSVSLIYFNGLVGTGATQVALLIQVSCVVLYMIYVYVVVGQLKADLRLAWLAELVYWIASFVISLLYLRSKRWMKVKI